VRQVQRFDAVLEVVLDVRNRHAGRDVRADVDHGLAIVARNQDLRRSADQLRDVREVNEVSVAGPDRNVAQVGLAFGVALRVEHLHVLGPVDRIELGGERAAEGCPHRLRREPDVHVEHARAIPIEDDVVLRCQLLGRAIDVGRPRRVGECLENLLRVGIGLAPRRRNRDVDRLRVPAARARCRNRDDLRVRHETMRHGAHLARILIGRFLMIGVEKDA
jgi:hypothetical protein